jgi:hypothetical protein
MSPVQLHNFQYLHPRPSVCLRPTVQDAASEEVLIYVTELLRFGLDLVRSR